MSFLKNIFGSSDKNIENAGQITRTITELFNEKIEELPDNTYYLSKKEKDESGNAKLFFNKKLSIKECGLFEHIEVILHSADNYNVVFESELNYDSLQLEKLTNNLYSIYGKDDNKKGLFSASEKNEIANRFWQGRNFFDEGRYPNLPPCSLYESEGKIYLTIFSPKNIERASDDQTISKNNVLKGISLLERLNDLGIDFSDNTQQGTDIEFTVEEEINGIIKKVFIPLEDHFFTSSILSIYENGNKHLFLSKNNSSEKDFKSFIDKTSDLFGLDIAGRSKFTIEDLNTIRGDSHEESEVYGIRHWIDLNSDYEIIITFDEDEKDLLFMIHNI